MFKKRMKLCILMGGLIASLLFFTSCSKGERKIQVKEVEPYIFEVEKFTELDYVGAEKFYSKNYDKWGGGCSCVAKNLDDGRVIFGRNMDLNISNKCAYIVRTECKDKLKTMGLAYTFRDYSPDYDIVKKNGISNEFANLLPFMCDDIMNEAGLYIEVNMRTGEVWPGGQDKFACSGTNLFSDKRVYMFGVSRYIAENCVTVEDAVKLAKTLNIYSEDKYWNYAFMIGDAFGNYGLLEFSMNNVYWIPYQYGQTNYYINEDSYLIQDQKLGCGRLEKLKSGIDKVKTKKDMFDLIDSVSYFQFYDPYKCKFDPRSENIGGLPGYTYDIAMNDYLKDSIMKIMDEYGKGIRAKSKKELKDANQYWQSAFTEVADCYEKSIFVRFFEDNKIKYILTFDGFERSNEY